MTELPKVRFRAFDRLICDLRQKPILLGVPLVLATLLLYGRVIHHQFLDFDDRQYVPRNIHVNTGLNLRNLAWAFTSFHAANWHPLTWISHMADCQLFGLNPGPPHLVNVVLHAINVLLLFLLLQKATGAVWRSFLVAALFAVHPLNVESVAWLAQRKSLLCTMFSLLTVAAYGWYARNPSWRKYAVVLLGFSLALMSKPMAVTLPVVLLFLDYWPLDRNSGASFRRRWGRLLLEKLPLVVMSAVSSGITMAAQRSGGAVAGILELPLLLRLGNAIVSYVRYIGKVFWPANLAIFYPHPQHALGWFDVLAAGVILLTITIAVLSARRAPYLVMGWFLFLVTLLPVIGIIQVGRQAMADRYAYTPCIGLFIIISWGLYDLPTRSRIPQFVPAVVSAALILALTVATVNYLPFWQNGVDLFTRAAVIAGSPDPAIEEALADALVSQGRYDDAYGHYAEACILRPQDALCHYNLAEILFNRNQLQDALQQYQIAGSLTDSKEMAVACLTNSGEILLDLGDYQAADVKLGAALQIDTNNSNALRLRQRVFLGTNSTDRQLGADAGPK
ncbi:MAG: tetratricopeptide repeat protein [Candidatus Sulfotelmatobacter sp.]